MEKSRRFYFPNNSAYVLLEVSLPESGTVVLGCVGKGVSFEYEYFAYAGPLKVEEFCLPDGSLVAQPKLASHLATHGRRVFSYSGSEFADTLRGNSNANLLDGGAADDDLWGNTGNDTLVGGGGSIHVLTKITILQRNASRFLWFYSRPISLSPTGNFHHDHKINLLMTDLFEEWLWENNEPELQAPFLL